MENDFGKMNHEQIVALVATRAAELTKTWHGNVERFKTGDERSPFLVYVQSDHGYSLNAEFRAQRDRTETTIASPAIVLKMVFGERVLELSSDTSIELMANFDALSDYPYLDSEPVILAEESKRQTKLMELLRDL